MTTPSTVLAVEAVLAAPFLLIGLSHLVRPQMWKEFFVGLSRRGTEGVLLRTFLFELWPAGVIVALHQDWSLPGVVVTFYDGWLGAQRSETPGGSRARRLIAIGLRGAPDGRSTPS